MRRAIIVNCLKCGTLLNAARGGQLAREIRCQRCGATFTVQPEEAGQPSGITARRVRIVLAAALLWLLGGVGLTMYCFARNAWYEAPSQAAEITQTTNAPAQQPPDTIAPLQAAPQPTVPVSAEDDKAINDAIIKGVWYLKGRSDPGNGNFTDADVPDVGPCPIGVTSLAGLTLLECGVPAKDPVLVRAAAFVRNALKTPAVTNPRDTYQAALAILFLDRLGDKQDEPLIQYLAMRLVAGQRPNDGGWDYLLPPIDSKDTLKLVYLLKDEKQSLDAWRKAAMTDPWPAGRSDNSNTQFAVLALWVAGRHDVGLDKTIAEVGNHFRTTQQADGSWWYSLSDGTNHVSPWSTMTCSALLGLAVAHGLSKDPAELKQKPLDDPVVQKALKVLADDINEPNEDRIVELYYLWSMERVAVLYNLTKIDNKDWYGWGCSKILPLQQQAPGNKDVDGSWAGQWLTGGSPVVATCFALLFLKQANLAQDLTSKLQLLEKK